jgi:hypothetical protein
MDIGSKTSLLRDRRNQSAGAALARGEGEVQPQLTIRVADHGV